MVMVYAGGHVSGAHYQPSRDAWGSGCAAVARRTDVALVLDARRSSARSPRRFATEIHRQGPGGILITRSPGRRSLRSSCLPLPSSMSLSTWRRRSHRRKPLLRPGHRYDGLMAGAFSVGMVSGAAFNPAVAIGISTMGAHPAHQHLDPLRGRRPRRSRRRVVVRAPPSRGQVGTHSFSCKLHGRTGDIFFSDKAPRIPLFARKKKMFQEDLEIGRKTRESVISLESFDPSGTFLFFAAERYPGSSAEKSISSSNQGREPRGRVWHRYVSRTSST